MAAWGMVGLTGGALGKLSSRRLGRLPLALACAATALCAKEVTNLYTWTLGATHTPAAFVLVAGAGLPSTSQTPLRASPATASLWRCCPAAMYHYPRRSREVE
jgi:hypothetical protein